MNSKTNRNRFRSSSFIVCVLISLGIGRSADAAFTLVDFAVGGDQANPNDPHEVFFPDFNTFTLMITGSFDTTQCYRVQLRHTGGSDCGSRNNSGNAVASVVEADHIVVTVAQTAQSDFKNGDNWIIEVKENRESCTGRSTDQDHPIFLRIAGCNQACLLEGPVMLTAEPLAVACGQSTQLCVEVGGSTGNLRYEWDLDGDNLFDELTTELAIDGNCIDFEPTESVLVGVNVVDQGTEVADCNETASVQLSVEGGCDDGIDCTTDTCDSETGCAFTPDDSNCNDGVACTDDVCDSELGCISTPNSGNCDDGVPCTNDACDPVLGCTNTPDDGNCDDGVSCTDDACDSELGCVNTPDNTNCADAVECTLDICDMVQGCQNTPDGSTCGDGIECTNDVCDPVQGCLNTPDHGDCSDGMPCTEDVCDPVQGCIHTPGDGECDDGVECTLDLCDPIEGCVNTPDNSSCGDGVECTVDVCDPVEGCLNTPDDGNCADGVECTIDVCDPAEGCTNTPDNGNCSDGVECTNDVCDAVQGCLNTPDETSCSDGVECTDDVCDPVEGCLNTPDNGHCTDGVECTIDVCDPAEGCTNTPDDNACADEVECTIDVCDAELGCQNMPDDASCGDGVECTDDICDPAEGCTNAPDNSKCDDGVECTMDVCDPADGCSSVPDDESCDDDSDCTFDLCDAELGCQNEQDLTDEDGDEIPDCLTCPTVDVVFVLDTSGSIEDEAEVLCAKNQEIIDMLGALGVEVRSTILGISDLPEIGFTCLTGTVVGQFGSTVPGNPGVCGAVSGREDWGPATSIVAANFDWTENAIRVIVPIADEGPCDGDPCQNPGADNGSIRHAIDIAHANSVRVAPITGDGSNACVVALANEIADATRLSSFASTEPGSDLAEAINDLLISICLEPIKNGGGGNGDDGDQCPANPDKTEPGVCGCNIPDKDTDGDSVPNCTDPTPLVPGTNGSDSGQETPTDGGGCGACGALGLATFPIATLGYAILLLMRRRRM